MLRLASSSDVALHSLLRTGRSPPLLWLRSAFALLMMPSDHPMNRREMTVPLVRLCYLSKLE
jgi:hypothetical protein